MNTQQNTPPFPLLAQDATLRDWFAGFAMLASIERHGFIRSDIGECCYEAADAMLTARSQGEKEVGDE